MGAPYQHARCTYDKYLHQCTLGPHTLMQPCVWQGLRLFWRHKSFHEVRLAFVACLAKIPLADFWKSVQIYSWARIPSIVLQSVSRATHLHTSGFKKRYISRYVWVSILPPQGVGQKGVYLVQNTMESRYPRLPLATQAPMGPHDTL